MGGVQNTLPPGHPDQERAQAFVDSLPQHNPARDRALGDPRRIAARTVVGIADGAGGAVVGKTLAGPWESDLPHNDLEAVLTVLRRLGRPTTNAELAALMGCSQDEASKHATACGAATVMQREGRTVLLSLPPRLS